MTFTRRLLAILVIAISPAALAGEYYVDQKHPAAADANPGTEALPWKTIGKGMATIHAGDTAWIKAGRYAENLKGFGHPGEVLLPNEVKYVTLAAYSNDTVVVEGTRKIEESEWKLKEGTKNVYQIPLDIGENYVMYPAPQVFVDGKRYLEAKEISVENKPDFETGTDDTQTHRYQAMSDTNPRKWLHDRKASVLYLNTGDGNPSKSHLVEVAINSCSLDVSRSAYPERKGFNTGVRLRGLTFDRLREGISGAISYSVIEDCVISYPGGDGIRVSGLNNIIRRNTVLHAGHQPIYWGRHCNVLEDNLIIGALEDPNIIGSAWEGVFKANGGRYSTIRNNVVGEVAAGPKHGAGSGIWCDIYSEFNAIYGNVVYRQGMGIYVEQTQNANLIAFNTCFDNDSGIGVRLNSFNMIFGNYLLNNSRSAMWFGSAERYPPMVGQRVEGNWFVGNKSGISVGDASPVGWNSVSLNRNTYDLADGAMLVDWGNTKYTDLKKLTAETGQEFNGKTGKVTEDEIQLIKFRVPHSRTPDLLVPMVANPTLLRVAPSGLGGYFTRPYFWRPGDGSGLSFSASMSSYPIPGLAISDGGAEVGGIGPSVLGPDGKMLEKHHGPGEKTWGVFVKGSQPQDMHPLGEGWWTPTLPTVAGTKYKIAWRALAEKLEPTASDPKAGPVVYARWTNDTGQNVIRQYVWGVDDQGKPHGKLASKGDYGWSEPESGNVVAPVGTTKVAFFFGLRNSKGTIRYRDMYLGADGNSP